MGYAGLHVEVLAFGQHLGAMFDSHSSIERHWARQRYTTGGARPYQSPLVSPAQDTALSEVFVSTPWSVRAVRSSTVASRWTLAAPWCRQRRLWLALCCSPIAL
eukprot:4069169-Amphidinium_carterae.2